MGKLAIVIGGSINWIILILGLITLAGFIWVVMEVDKLHKKMDEDHRKSRGRVDYTSGGFQRNPDTYTWEDTQVYLEDFNKILMKYDMFGQFVPIFPLLGILGTVAGLIEKLSDISEMQAALSTSMSTTFFGLIAAIVLKLVDALLVSRRINERSLYFDTFEQNYRIARDKHLQENQEADK